MRALIAISAILAIAACGGDKTPPNPAPAPAPTETAPTPAPVETAPTPAPETQPAPAADTTAPVKAADTTKPAAVAPPAKRPTFTKETLAKAKRDMAAFKRLLNEGRKLAASKDYDAAIAKFAKADALAPGHPSALGEHGWAAFNAGAYDIAERKTRLALLTAKEPKRRAAILYNLGRVLEAKKDPVAAIDLYARSVSLRTNATVSQRLADLRSTTEELGDVDEKGSLASVCAAAMAEWDCTPGGDPEDDLIGDCECTPSVSEAKTPGGLKAAALLSLTGDAGVGGDLDGSEYLAVQGPDDKWHLIGMVAESYDPGVDYVHNDGEARMALGTHLDAPGKGEEVIVEAKNGSYDMNPGIESYDDSTTLQWTFCRAVGVKIRCAQLTRGVRYETGPLEPFEEGEPMPEGETTVSNWVLEVSVETNGTITVTQPSLDDGENEVPDSLAPVVGTHPLKAFEAFEGVEVIVR